MNSSRRLVLSAVAVLVCVLASLTTPSHARQVAIVTMTGSGEVSFIDIERAHVIRTVRLKGRASLPKQIAVTPDGATAVVASETGYVSFLDVKRMMAVETLELLAGPEMVDKTLIPNEFEGVAITPDGSMAIVTECNEEGQLFFINMSTMTVMGPPLVLGDEPYMMIIKSDGAEGYVLDNGSFHILRSDGSYDYIFQPMGTEEVYHFALTPDQSRAILVGSDRKIALLDISTQDWPVLHYVLTEDLFAGPSTVAVSPDGSLAAVGNGTGQTLTFVTVRETTLEVEETIPLAGTPSSVAFSPDGRTVVAALANTSLVQLVDVATRTVTDTIKDRLGLTPMCVVVVEMGSELN